MPERSVISVLEAKQLPKSSLAPCNSCSLEPNTCDKQYGPHVTTIGEIVLMCNKYGPIRWLNGGSVGSVAIVK